MRAVLVQPPFVQLNAPYPAVHYLEAFLRSRGVDALACDHSIALYRRIFSRPGLAKVFADARAALRGGRGEGGKAAAAGAGGEPELAVDRAQLDRYFSYEGLYLEWIEGLVDFLSGGDPAMAHRLAAAAELPRGARAEAFLAARGGRIGQEEARALATRILDDLGDFVAFALDPSFGTVRYAERLAASRADFAELRAALDDSWLLREFYGPMLEEFWGSAAGAPGAARASGAEGAGGAPAGRPDLVLISVPFPGCLLGALACARAARRILGAGGAAPRVVIGGGYVSTELRGLRDPAIFDFCDFLAFDAGYGSLASILELEDGASGGWGGGAAGGGSAGALSGGGRGLPAGAAAGLYRTMARGTDGGLLVAGFPEGDAARAESGPGRSVLDCVKAEEFARLERGAVAGVFPDYRSADFRAYLRIVDSDNPMHRLWSEAPWLKYGLAHGCYWRKCAFCDTELEYVADFARARMGPLFEAAERAAGLSGLSGIHFVDEAMPMAALLDFAKANRARAARGGRPFSFWGNVRFDASWTPGRCEFLAASGLVAASGGVEIATERGLEMTGKGFDLAGLVRTLVAMRRAGLLVHTYLIYGFPGQSPGDIVDSAEFCRQLFASGLVDSAFWHRFVLTRHSRMYREWREGKRPGLAPLDRPWSFADNDLSFEGEPAFDRFDAPLAASLGAWMEARDLEKPVSVWFGKGFPRPTIAPDLAESLIARAEADLDGATPSPGARAFWVGGRLLGRGPAAGPGGRSGSGGAGKAGKRGAAGPGRARLTWAYRGELRSAEIGGAEGAAKAERAAELLGSPALSLQGLPFAELQASLALPAAVLAELLAAGLVLV